MSAAILPALSSARGLLSLLDDPEPALQQHALQQLDDIVDNFWPEIATDIPKMSATRKPTTETELMKILSADLFSKMQF